MGCGIYSTITFGQFGEVYVHHEIMLGVTIIGPPVFHLTFPPIRPAVKLLKPEGE